MIPPLQQARLTSIAAWLKSNPETARLSSAQLRQRARRMDRQMMETFDARERAALEASMVAGKWGTSEGQQAFDLQRLEIWNEIVSETLPAMAERGSEA
jgi:hypothetical protein